MIDAPEFDTAVRREIYQAQLDALAEIEGQVADFRVINRREVEGDLEEILPEIRTGLFKR